MAGRRIKKARHADTAPGPTQRERKLTNRRRSLTQGWATARSGTARVVLAAEWAHAAALHAQDPAVAARIGREADRLAVELVALGDTALPPKTATERARRHAA